MSKAIIPYFSLLTSEEHKSADIVIFGDIVSKGSIFWDEFYPADVNAYDLVAQLNSIPEDYEITVHINSNGGEVKEGLAIYNALKTRNVTTVCEGFAASAASLVFMGGTRRIMNAASLLFIHQANTFACGNPDELEKVAGDLRTITQAAAQAYKEAGVTLSDDELYEMLKAETWIKAEDALSQGFATEIAETEDETEGVVTNSAMPLIVEALTNRPEPEGTIRAELVERFIAGVDRLEQLTQRPAPVTPAPVTLKKGFFNLKED